MKFWQNLCWTEPEQIVEVCEYIEECGLDGVFVADHGLCPKEITSPYPYTEDGKAPLTAYSFYPDAWVTLSMIAARTERLLLSIAVYILPLRNPFEVAKSSGTLMLLSNNRLWLGVGLGWMREEFEQFGVNFKTRGKRCDEMLEILPKLWRDDFASYQGEFFNFTDMKLTPAPKQRPPIIVGGHSDAALHRAARYGDGWLNTGNSPDEVVPLMRKLDELLKQYGRESEPFEKIVALSEDLNVDTLKRLEEQGMTSCMLYPFTFSVSETSTLESKKFYLEKLVETIIEPMS